jgi:hypothetical protein
MRFMAILVIFSSSLIGDHQAGAALKQMFQKLHVCQVAFMTALVAGKGGAAPLWELNELIQRRRAHRRSHVRPGRAQTLKFG